MARKRRTKAEILAAKSEGLGDTVEKVLEVTGVSKVAKWLLGDDCKCDERKKTLNALFPYRKVKCLTESEHEILKNWFDKNTNVILPSEQHSLFTIHARVFGVRNEPTSCVPCIKEKIEQLKTVFLQYNE